MIFQNPTQNLSLPRMGFDFGIDGVDDNRKTHRLNPKAFGAKTTNQDAAFNSVPYNFNFSLQVYTNDIEDSLQIVEQILPFFQPSLTVKIKPFSEYPDFVTDVTVILNSVSYEHLDSEMFEYNDYYSWKLDFTVKGWLFSPIQSESVILDVNVNLFEMTSGELVDYIEIKANE